MSFNLCLFVCAHLVSITSAPPSVFKFSHGLSSQPSQAKTPQLGGGGSALADGDQAAGAVGHYRRHW